MSQPIVNQPGQVPAPISGVPDGLETLTNLDQFLIKKQMNCIELLTRQILQKPNKYIIQDSSEQQLSLAVEESEFCNRQLKKRNRAFKMHIKDQAERNVIEIERPGIICPVICAKQENVTVRAPLTGEILGFVRVDYFCFCLFPKITICDKDHNEIFILYPSVWKLLFCSYSICKNIEIPINDMNGNKCGSLDQLYPGLCSMAIKFRLSVPIDLDVKLKATLLGAVFMIDFAIYEY